MALSQLSCPSCSEEKALRRSHFRVFDVFNLLIRRRPYRCLICNRRFYSHFHHTPSPKVGIPHS
jgi:hypothetical protein